MKFEVNGSIFIIGIMFILSLFGTKLLGGAVSAASGKEIDGFRTISLVIAVLRLANECYDIVFKKDPSIGENYMKTDQVVIIPERESLE